MKKTTTKNTKTTKAVNPSQPECPSCQITAMRMLLVCATDRPKNIGDVMANLTMQLVAHSVLRYGSLDAGLTKISEGINVATAAFKK